jgi:hypothetical protein
MCLPDRYLATIRGCTVQSRKMLQALATTVILGSESHGIHDHVTRISSVTRNFCVTVILVGSSPLRYYHKREIC